MGQAAPIRQVPRAAHGAPLLDDLVAAALDNAPVGLIVLDRDLTVRLVTSTATGLLGVRKGRDSPGQPVHQLLSDCGTLSAQGLRALATALEDAAFEPQDVLLHLEGAPRRVVAADIREAGDTGFVISLEDVTQTRQTQDWLLEHVSSDPVTGLWNRQHFLLMLQDSLTAAEISGDPSPCVLLIGLGRVKAAMQSLAPGVEDALLRMAAERVAGLLGEDDMLARFGSDEFAMAWVRPPGRDAVAERCLRLLAALSQPCMVDGHRVILDVHIGIAMAPDDGASPHDLSAHAGLAMQAASMHADTAPRFFDRGLTERALARRALEGDLRHALERGEFELHYQPQFDVQRGRVTGLEALIRWRCPSRGLVPPAAFIAIAEEMGLICEIGDWVLHEACRAAVLWPDDVTVAVNASPLQFETGHFARSVAEALGATGLPARRLEVEVTENLLLRDTGLVLSTLASLEALGVRLVLDDFGTGYASLSQLSRFRFDKIKIDRSFVSPACESHQNSAIVRSIAALGTSLGIPTTAEGVETQSQLLQIKSDGCTCVQGYYFSRPVPFIEVSNMMNRLNHQQGEARSN